MDNQPKRWRVPAEMGGWVAVELFHANPLTGGYVTLRAPGGYKILMDPKDLRAYDGWRCPRCNAPNWVRTSLNGGLTVIRQCVPCGHYSSDVA